MSKKPENVCLTSPKLIKLQCFIDPVLPASATVFEELPQELQNVSYSVSYHVLADADNPASVRCVQHIAQQSNAMGWNRFWVKKALELGATMREAGDLDGANDGNNPEVAELEESTQLRISSSQDAAEEYGVTELPALVWKGKRFVGEGAVEALVEALIAAKA